MTRTQGSLAVWPRLPRAITILCLIAVAIGVTGCRKRKTDSTDSEQTQTTTATAPPPATETAPPPPPPAPAPVSFGGRKVGDTISVMWKGKCYAARITAVPAPGTYRITYVGYSSSWDETIGESRVCGGAAAPPPPPEGGHSRRVGDSVNVRWKGRCYAARIKSIPRPGAYFISYVGYASSWDETVGEDRICK